MAKKESKAKKWIRGGMTMTVKELIKALELCNPDAKLRVIGYPCGDEVTYTLVIDNEDLDDPVAFVEEVDK